MFVRFARAALALTLLATSGCAYFNTLYNARGKFREATEIKRKSDPERPKISVQEEKLYTETFEQAARVVKYWPESRWVDDALLLMGRASLEKGDYSTALRKFDEILTIYPDSDLRQETMFYKGRTLIATKDLTGAVETLNAAAELGGDRWRADVLHHLGLVRAQQGDTEGALQAFSDVVHRHRDSEWSGLSGLEAGRMERERGNLDAAAGYFDRVRKHGRTAEEKFLGGMRKGDVLVEMHELERARNTYSDVADQAVKEERRGQAFLAEARTVAVAGDTKRAEELFREIIVKFPRKEAAAEARFAIGQLRDKEGNLELARTEYEAVKEEGTGHDASQKAAARATEITRVLDLRKAVETGGSDRDKNRFLLAEQLLEQIGDTDRALAEYSQLAEEARGSEWGAKALYAEAWVLENRLNRREEADSALFRLANSYSGTDVDAVARHRFGFPVWKVEEIEAPRVVYIRSAGEAKEIEDVVLERVAPPNLPLPQGERQATVWVRVGLSRDGSVEETKVVKSAGPEMDQACLEAARASRFVSPNDGGPEVTVLQYVFTPAGVSFGKDAGPSRRPIPNASSIAPADSAARANSEAPSRSAAPADSLAPVPSQVAPQAPPQTASPVDSIAPPTPPPGAQDSLPSIRDLRFDRND
jgi:TonB family protein